VVTGQRDTGKTTFVKHLLAQLATWLLFDVHDEYGPQGTAIPTIAAIPEYWKRNYRKLRYVGPTEISHFKLFAEAAWKLQNTTIVVEEAELYFASKGPGLKGFENYLVHRGRHRGLGLIAVTRRVADLHKDVLSQAKTIVSFTQFLPNDIMYLRTFMGDVAKELITLPRWHFLVWREGKSQIFNPI